MAGLQLAQDTLVKLANSVRRVSGMYDRSHHEVSSSDGQAAHSTHAAHTASSSSTDNPQQQCHVQAFVDCLEPSVSRCCHICIGMLSKMDRVSWQTHQSRLQSISTSNISQQRKHIHPCAPGPLVSVWQQYVPTINYTAQMQHDSQQTHIQHLCNCRQKNSGCKAV